MPGGVSRMLCFGLLPSVTLGLDWDGGVESFLAPLKLYGFLQKSGVRLLSRLEASLISAWLAAVRICWRCSLLLLFCHSGVSASVTPRTTARQALLSFTLSWSLLRLMSIELMMSFNHLILYLPLLPPSVFPNIRVFSNELAVCIKWLSIGASASESVLGFWI